MGDNGEGDFQGGVIALVFSTDPQSGGNDTITGGDGGNVVIGGIGDDTIKTGKSVDWVLGDNGLAQFTVVSGALAPLALQTTDTAFGGNDTINVNDGDNIVFGGAGEDRITAGNGDNDIIGDNNTPDGAVGNDTIQVGDGNNVILGDNGQIDRTVIHYDWGAMQWARDPAPFNDLIRQVTTYGLLGGNDHIVAGDGMNRIFGQGGDDDISAGNGSNEIIGGLGSNAIGVGSGNNIILIGEGRISRALDANGAPVLNSDGVTWHRDVVLTELGSITGAVALDSMGDALQPDLASSLLDADAILLGGSYNADGSKVIDQTAQAWRTEALLVKLEAVSGGSVKAGDGANYIFGTTGDDAITVGDGANVIFGDRAVNNSAEATDIPHILNGYLIVAADPSTGITLPFNGQLVTPVMNLLPSLLTPNLPQLELGPGDLPGSIAGLAQAGDLTSGDGSYFVASASVIPQLLRQGGALSGNDTITAGNGDNLIFGDYGIIGAVPTTGLQAIDEQLQGLSVTAMGLLTQLSALSTAQDALDVAQGAASPYVVAIGNDHITVGTGSNTIFGDVGQYLIPGVGVARGTGPLASNALAFDARLLDMQEIFGDASFVVNEAGRQVIANFASTTHFQGVYDPSAPLRSATHLLSIGDDVITIKGGYGADLVIGDNGVVIMPGVGTATVNWASGVSAAELGSVDQQLRALEASRGAAMSAQFAADHPFTPEYDAAAQSLFKGGKGFQLNIGDDTISGGGGRSTIIGDTGLILDPVIAAGASSAAAANDVEAIMVATIDRLFLGAYSAAGAIADSHGVAAVLAQAGVVDWSSAGGYVFNGSSSDIRVNSDKISAGDGAGLIFGDNGVVLPQMGSATGLVSAFRAFPSGETGGTPMADYNYIYGFGPLGSLHTWISPASAPSHFAVDADTITGGAGANVMFGELGDDVIAGGSGNDQISGGWGFNTVSGGGGTNYIVYNRAHDAYLSSGGHDIARSALAVSAASTILQTNLSSPIGLNLADGMLSDPPASLHWSGQAHETPLVYTPVTPASIQAASFPGFGASSGGTVIGGFFSATSIPPVEMPVESFIQSVSWLAPVLPPLDPPFFEGLDAPVTKSAGGQAPDVAASAASSAAAPVVASDPAPASAAPSAVAPVVASDPAPASAALSAVVSVVASDPAPASAAPSAVASVVASDPAPAPAAPTAVASVAASDPAPAPAAPSVVASVAASDPAPASAAPSVVVPVVASDPAPASAAPSAVVPVVASDPAPASAASSAVVPVVASDPAPASAAPTAVVPVVASDPAPASAAPSVVVPVVASDAAPASAAPSVVASVVASDAASASAAPSAVVPVVASDPAPASAAPPAVAPVVTPAPAENSASSDAQQAASLPPAASATSAHSLPAPVIASGLVMGHSAPVAPVSGVIPASAAASLRSQHTGADIAPVGDLAALSLFDPGSFVATVPSVVGVDALAPVAPAPLAPSTVDLVIDSSILSISSAKPAMDRHDTATVFVSSSGGPVRRFVSEEVVATAVDSGIVREFVPMDGLIRAIRESEITVRMTGAAASHDLGADLRVFDEARGMFVAPPCDPASFILDLDQDALDRDGVSAVDHPSADFETVAMALPGPSWISFLKKFGRGEGGSWLGR